MPRITEMEEAETTTMVAILFVEFKTTLTKMYCGIVDNFNCFEWYSKRGASICPND